jgi:hypothetical protein
MRQLTFEEVSNVIGLPNSVNFSSFGMSQDIEEPIEFGQDDPAITDGFKENYFLFMLKTLPKDRYRVVALLLFIREELDYDYTYADIASIWGIDKSNIVKMMKQMQKTFISSKIVPKRYQKTISNSFSSIIGNEKEHRPDY